MSICILYGVGPGLGHSLAKAFLPSHHVALVSRSKANLEPLVQRLRDECKGGNGNQVEAFESGLGEEGMKKVFEAVEGKFAGARWSVGVWNAATRPMPLGGFLEKSPAEFEESVQTNILTAATFSRHLLPRFLANPLPSSFEPRGALLFTGATASVRGSLNMAPFTVGKFGLRALSQSLAREFGPQGIHVAHTIVDAVIERDLDNPSEKYLQPDSMAQAYVFLASQDRTSFTQEMDLRTGSEKF